MYSNLVKDHLSKMRTHSTESCLHGHTRGAVILLMQTFAGHERLTQFGLFSRAHADVTLRWEQLRNSRSKFAPRAVAIMNRDHRAVSRCNIVCMLPFGALTLEIIITRCSARYSHNYCFVLPSLMTYVNCSNLNSAL